MINEKVVYEILKDERLDVHVQATDTEGTMNNESSPELTQPQPTKMALGTQNESRSVLSVQGATLHGQQANPVPSDEELLATFTPQIRQHLHGGNRELARVGAYLSFAKRAMANGIELSSDRETTFTKWYQHEFKLSPDRARRLMRWVRPVLDVVDWNDDDDLILNELAAIGPCVFDEVQKFPQACWRFTETGLVLLTEVTGVAEVAVKNLSFREVKELRERFLSPAPAPATSHNEVVEQADETEPDQIDDQEGHEVALSESSDDEYDDSRIDVISDSKSNGEDDSDESGCSNVSKEEDAGDDPDADEDVDADDGAESATGNVYTCHDYNVATTTAPSTVRETTNNKPVNLHEAAQELWLYGEVQEKKLTVVNGKMRATDDACASLVSGVNVKFEVQDFRPQPVVINELEDAFFASKTGENATIHWFDHGCQRWQSARVAIDVTEQE